jgi:pimeloyl-ACP methyl ester carboxylesterase
MAHLLPENPDPARKRLVIFVHGFGSSVACWAPLLKLFKQDPDIAGAFDLACYEYPTPWFNWRFLRRIPTLAEIAGGLANFLESAAIDSYRELILVGHSQGGLVIQRYLVDRLSRGKVEDLYRLRLVVLIATPNLGSTLLSRTRKLFSLFFSNPQERSLRVFDTQIDEVRATITERVVGARGETAVDWPIPVQCVYGMEDGVVVEASARGPFEDDTLLRVPGDHFSVIRPADRNDTRYMALREALLEPCGHRCVYEIDLYDIRVAIEPIPGGRHFEFTHGGRAIGVQTDNFARIDRKVKFSRKNRCNELYLLRYGTRNDGYIIPHPSQKNEASSQDQQVYEDYGTSFTFGFRPKGSETYGLLVEVYKGFEHGHRDIHFHLAPTGKKVYFKTVRLSIDLSAYMKAGWTVSDTPKLYHHLLDEGHSQLCNQRQFGQPIPARSADPSGVWIWELTNLRGGVIDAIWDVAQPGSD